MAYPGSVDLISGIRPKNNGTFPLVNAQDVYIDDNTRLPEALKRISADPATYGWPFIGVASTGAPEFMMRQSAFPVTYTAQGENHKIVSASGATLDYEPEVSDEVHMTDLASGIEIATFSSSTGALVTTPSESNLAFADGDVSVMPIMTANMRAMAVNIWTPPSGAVNAALRITIVPDGVIGMDTEVTEYIPGTPIARGEILSHDGLVFHSRTVIAAADNTSWDAVKQDMDYMARELLFVVDCSERTKSPILDWPAQVDMSAGGGVPTAPRSGFISTYRCSEYMPKHWTVELVSGGSSAAAQSVKDGTVAVPSRHATLADVATMVIDTEAGWLADPEYVPEAGRILVWTDAAVDGGAARTVRIKIGDGVTNCASLQFADGAYADRVAELASSLSSHERDMVRHVTAAERSYWNDKVTTDPVVANETLSITKANLLQ